MNTKESKKKKVKGWSLRKKLLVTMIGMSILPMLVLGIIVYGSNVSKGLKEFRQQTHKEIEIVDDGLVSYFNAVFDQVGVLAEVEKIKQIDERITEYITKPADNPDGTISMTPERNNDFEREIYLTFKRIKDKQPQFFSISLGVEKHGGFLMYPEKPRKKGYDARERGWYKTIRNSEKDRGATDFYVSSDGSASVEMLQKIYNFNGDFVGVLNFSFDLKEFQEKIAAVTIGKTGNLMVVDRVGTIVSHPKGELIGTKIGELGIAEYQEISNMTQEEVVYSDGQKEYIMQAFPSVYEPLGWTYILTMDKQEMDSIKAQKELLQSLAVTMFVVLLVVLGFTVLLVNTIRKPIRNLSKTVEKIADFDLTSELDEKILQQGDEIGSLARSMNKMKRNLHKMVSSILEHAMHTAATAQELSATAQKTSGSADELSQAVSNIAQGAHSQAEDVQVAGESLENISSLVREMEVVLNEMVGAVENIRIRKDEGKKY